MNYEMCPFCGDRIVVEDITQCHDHQFSRVLMIDGHFFCNHEDGGCSDKYKAMSEVERMLLLRIAKLEESI